MFIHKDSVDSQGGQRLMKIGSILMLASLALSVYTRTLCMGAGILDVLVRDRGFQAILKLFVLALAVWVSISIVVVMFLVYKHVES